MRARRRFMAVDERKRRAANLRTRRMMQFISSVSILWAARDNRSCYEYEAHKIVTIEALIVCKSKVLNVRGF
jgi:hypothetical protein